MADIRPFAGIRYTARAGSLDAVATQPYDKVNAAMHKAYVARSANSFVRLILPEGDDKYRASADLCARWLKEGILGRDPKPAYYVYHEEFETGGRKLVRKAFVGAIRVEEFSKGTVLPHEFTLSKPKADRMNLLRTTRMDYEQIFMLYSDPKGAVDSLLAPSGRPEMEATDEYGVVHRVWAVTDPAKLAAVRREMSAKVLLIADGHHRYETALAVREELEKAGPVPDDAAVRFKLTAFVNMADPGLVILPTHRLLANLPGFDPEALVRKLAADFSVRPVADAEAEAELGRNKDGQAFVLYAGRGRSWLLRLNDRQAAGRWVPKERSADYKELDVVVLHAGIIEGVLGISRDKVEDHVRYERYWNETVKRVDSGEAVCAFFMNPTRPEQVQKLAEQGERMPQKSTDFYPKLLSGLVFMDVTPEQKLP